MPFHAQERAINKAGRLLETLLVNHGIFGISGHPAKVTPSRAILSTTGGSGPSVKAATIQVALQALGHNNLEVPHVMQSSVRPRKPETPEERLAAFIHKLALKTREKHPNITHTIDEWMEDGKLKGYRVVLTHK